LLSLLNYLGNAESVVKHRGGKIRDCDQPRVLRPTADQRIPQAFDQAKGTTVTSTLESEPYAVPQTLI
jgi:hypothetical protein